jgi:hypothetical protein
VPCSDQALEIHIISREQSSVGPGQILIRRQARFRTSFHMIAELPQWCIRQVPNHGRAGRATLWTHGSTEASGPAGPAVVPLRRVADLNEPTRCTTRRGARQGHEVRDGLPAVRHRASGSPCCGRPVPTGTQETARVRGGHRRHSRSGPRVGLGPITFGVGIQTRVWWRSTSNTVGSRLSLVVPHEPTA